MPTGAFMSQKNLLPAVKSGKLSESVIDEKVRRLLLTAARFGWLDREQKDDSISLYDTKNNDLALRSARESMVLLKNEGGLLPLDKSRVKSVLVVGPNAYPGAATGGGSASVVPFHTVSLLDGMGTLLGDAVKVYYDRGVMSLEDMAQQTEFVTEADGGKPGVKMEAFAGRDLSGTAAAPEVIRYMSRSAIDGITSCAASGKPLNAASMRWTGYYNAADAGGRYILAMQELWDISQNRVYVDDKLIFDNWDMVLTSQPHVTLELTPGMHKVVVENRGESKCLKLGIVAEDKVVRAQAKELAAKADAVIVAAGFDHDSESEGTDRTFELPFGQDALIGVMAAANPKTIVALTSGGNVASERWISKVPAYIAAWYGGQAGGRALAEVLFGEVNPSGKLPVTFEVKAEDNPTFANYYPAAGSKIVEYKEGIFVGYRGYEHNHVKPLFPFGFGLSYTTFSFSNLKVTGDGATATVSFDVTNTGQRAGAEVAQVYVSDGHAKVARPAKELKGFEKVTLAAGETKRVSVPLTARSFAYWDVDAKSWKIAPGKFTILVGDSSASANLKGDVEVSSAAAEAAQF